MAATPEDVRARLAQANRAAREAAAGFERDSQAALARLKTRPIRERFAALEDGAAQLLPEHGPWVAAEQRVSFSCRREGRDRAAAGVRRERRYRAG